MSKKPAKKASARRCLATISLALVAACANKDHLVIETKSTSPGQLGQLAPNDQRFLDSLSNAVLADTSTAASKELNLMTTPIIDVTPLRVFDRDTLQWTATPDSCAMTVRSFGPTAGVPGYGGDNYTMSEARGTIGPGAGPDVSPSPDGKKLAYVSLTKLSLDTTKWSYVLVDSTKVPIADIDRVAERHADGSRWLSLVMILGGDSDVCAGDSCTTPMVSPVYGGRRIAWSADSRVLFVNDPLDSTRWTAIDPSTTKPSSLAGEKRYEMPWATRAVASAIASPPPKGITGGGPYRFTVRGDSIVVTGPNRAGKTAERVVGAGVPLAATRNGEYLLAVRRDKGRVRAVLYGFRIVHSASPTACPGPG